MSTRSVIAEPWGDAWRGRYHHFDGYPSGLGLELHHLHRVFGGDVAEMRRVLITDEPVGWSTIIGADWSQAPCFPDFNLEPCGECGRPAWTHYGQYYAREVIGRPGEVIPSRYAGVQLPLRRDQVQQFDHEFQRTKVKTGPLSYSARGETPREADGNWITWNGDDMGAEWAYVLAPFGLVILERRYGCPDSDGGHGVGMFGTGASDTDDGGYWRHVAVVAWDARPDGAYWAGLDRGQVAP